MKRAIALLLSVVFLLSFAACGKSDDTPAVQTEPAETTEAAAGGTETGTVEKIVFAYPIFYDDPRDLQEVQDAMNAITEAEIGIGVELKPMSFGSYIVQSNMMLTANEDLDLFLCFNDATFSQYASKGQLLDLTELVPQYENLDAHIEKLGARQCFFIDGKMYGYPSSTYYGSSLGLYIREDYAAAIDIDPDKAYSMEELGDVFAQLKEKFPNMAPLAPLTGSTYAADWVDFLNRESDDYGLLSEDGTAYENYFASEPYKEVLSTARDWYEKGYFINDPDTNQDDFMTLVYSGMAASFIMANSVNNLFGGFVVLPIDYTPIVTTTTYQTAILAVPSYSQKGETVLRYLDYCASHPEVANLYMYGIEGKHYVVTDEEHGLIDYPEGMSAMNNGYGTTSFMEFADGIYWFNTGKLENYEEARDAYYARMVPSKVLGFSFNTESLKNEMTAVTSVLAKYRTSLENGTIAYEDYLPQMLEELSNAGYDTILAERNRQLTEWLETQ